MLKYISSLVFLILISYGCSDNSVNSDLNEINGTWKLVKITGGFGGNIFNENDIGYFAKRVYNENGKYFYYKNDTLKCVADYLVQKEPTYGYMIKYSNIIPKEYPLNSIDSNEFAKIYNDTLNLWDGMADGYFYTWKKIK